MQFEYYALLEIERTANPDEIKRAYKKKAMELHPDRHGGDKWKEAEFKKLNEAYSILSDESKKAHYDRFGSMDGHGNFGGGGFGWGVDMDLGDIFSSFFGGWFGGGSWRRKQDIWQDIEIELKISLEDAIKWTSRKISYTKNHVCHHCNGQWGETIECSTCHGKWQVRERIQTVFGVMEQSRECSICHGSGKKITHACSVCHGATILKEKTEKTIEVPRGIEEWMSIKLRWEGQGGRDGNGDLYVTFSVPDKEGWLSRDGVNLHFVYEISPAVAVLGIDEEITIPILGKKRISIDSWTQSGTMIVFRGEWMARLDRKWAFWDLWIEIVVNIPKKLSSDQKKLYEALLHSEWGKKMKSGWLESLFSEMN